ncbi:hypothetical protein ACFQZJ_07035 [Maribacter chungangensis]|uniref:Uncharacterized protein n=1 Tax=Maribacter chungangensis TaxID=1069117 RepID=A0ABW3B1L5_9FLAO
MSSALSKYSTQIQELTPLLDSKFFYDASRWDKLTNDAKNSVNAHSNQEISRIDVINSFSQYFKGKSDYLYPFTMTMIWGFADTGYGTYRTNKYLSLNENRIIINDAFECIAEGKIKEAHQYLIKINGLNISYISKLLYFGTRARNQKDYTLIFDIRVARALAKLLDTEGIMSLLSIGPSNKYEDFERYNTLIHHWADELKVEAENIEVFLFNGDF